MSQALRDMLQAMSNSAASTVSAPVDGLAWLMRKAGVPIPQNAMGGSQWMEDAGLTRPVQPGMAQLAGDTLGMLAPLAAVARGPQIASALNQAGDNLAAPRTLNPQQGAIAWHGSPHKFDRFDSSKIGTGEGAQAYGHGLYLAESPDVAGSYAQSVKANTSELIKRGAAHGLPEDVASNLAAALQSGKNFDPLLDSARKMIDNPLAPAPQQQAAQRLLDHEMPAYNAWSEWSNPGQVYKVDLPDEHIARMLDWDAPLSQQAPGVRETLQAADRRAKDSLFQNGGEYYRALMARAAQDAPLHMSLDAAENMAQGPASQQLRKLGIPGIRYLDGGSRGAGTGTRNYVVFPGEENALRILERNGQRLP